MRGLGIAIKQRLLDNLAIFENKWGKQVTTKYAVPNEDRPAAVEGLEPAKDSAAHPAIESVHTELPGAVVKPHSSRVRLSLSMIVRNEEHHLRDCLASIADLVDEIVIVDTGSNDRTIEIAREFGARVFQIPWPDSFAAARNESLRHCTGDWILWLDADDRLSPPNRERLRLLRDSLGDEIAGYSMKVRSELDNGRSVRLLDQVRLFPRHPRVQWRYRVHEQILPGVNEIGGAARWTDIEIEHVGYQDASKRGGKLERNLKLLLL